MVSSFLLLTLVAVINKHQAQPPPNCMRGPGRGGTNPVALVTGTVDEFATCSMVWSTRQITPIVLQRRRPGIRDPCKTITLANRNRLDADGNLMNEERQREAIPLNPIAGITAPTPTSGGALISMWYYQCAAKIETQPPCQPTDGSRVDPDKYCMSNCQPTGPVGAAAAIGQAARQYCMGLTPARRRSRTIGLWSGGWGYCPAPDGSQGVAYICAPMTPFRGISYYGPQGSYGFGLLELLFALDGILFIGLMAFCVCIGCGCFMWIYLRQNEEKMMFTRLSQESDVL